MKNKNFLSTARMAAFIIIIGASSGLFVACSDKATDTVAPTENLNATNEARAEQGITGQYIVVLKEEDASLGFTPGTTYEERTGKVKNYGQALLKRKGIGSEKIKVAYGKAIKGFAGAFTPAEAALLRKDERVAYVEQDQIISLGKPLKSPKGPKPTEPAPTPEPTPEPTPDPVNSTQVIPYGINRVGYGDGTGKTAWVIDSGIDLDHPDLNVDVTRSRSFVSGSYSADDANGHGTHVAGTIAAKNNTYGVVGVAANASVVAVRVLDASGNGTASGVIAGIDYVAANGKSGDVANMSLGGSAMQAIDDAVLRASNAGILFAIAAGNSGSNAAYSSPARVNGANIFTVSAMDSYNNWASFSNYGNPPVDYCMPGVYINSTWLNGSYNTISGTSMATPHMAGVLLLKGKSFTILGYVNNDPDGQKDPIAHL
ncbi:MAG: S8 family serine peptidase [Adhaeribacter sp.]